MPSEARPYGGPCLAAVLGQLGQQARRPDHGDDDIYRAYFPDCEDFLPSRASLLWIACKTIAAIGAASTSHGQ